MPDPASENTRLSFGWPDWVIIAAYLLMLLAIGWYHSMRQRTIKEYFLAGKHMSWLPLGLSLMAALNSGIDYLTQPSAFLKFGIVIILGSLSWLVIYPYAFFVTMPMYRRLDVYSAYEYLDNRFNVAVRCLASAIFILWRLGWMATALYVPCLAFHTATGGRLPLKPTILVLGAVATAYTMLGGVKAVIWTEVIQFLVMFSGLLLTLVVIFASVPIDAGELLGSMFQSGAASTATREAAAGFGAQILELFREPVTWYGVLIATVVGRLPVYTGDQIMVQRFQTSRSIRDVRQGFLITAISDSVWMVALIFVGVALSIFFRTRELPAWVSSNTDYYFPYFMSLVFPPGTTGPVIAAIIAASLSAIASAINSQSTVIFVDFYNRLVKGRRRPIENPDAEEQRFQLRLSRTAAVVAGLAGTLLACQLDRLGTLFEIGNKVIQTFTGPMLAIFWLGMFTRRATSLSAFLGGLVGTLVGVYVAFFSSLSFLWPCTFGFGSALVVGYLAGLPSPITESARRWTWFAIMRRTVEE
jgi:SSS family transporter